MVNRIALKTFFRLDLDLFITEDDVVKLCELRSDMPDYSKFDSNSFLKSVPDPTSVLLFYVHPENNGIIKPRKTIEFEVRSHYRGFNNSTPNIRPGSVNKSLRCDSTIHTIKPPSPPIKQNSRRWKNTKNPENITSNRKIQTPLTSTIVRVAESGCIKKHLSVEPYKKKQGTNIYLDKSRICEFSSVDTY